MSTEIKDTSKSRPPAPRMVTLTIEGKSVTVPVGTTVLRAAIAIGRI